MGIHNTEKVTISIPIVLWSKVNEALASQGLAIRQRQENGRWIYSVHYSTAYLRRGECGAEFVPSFLRYSDGPGEGMPVEKPEPIYL